MPDLDLLAAEFAKAHRSPHHRLPAEKLAILDAMQAYEVQEKVLSLLGQSVPVAKVALGPDSVGLGAPIPSHIVWENGALADTGGPIDGLEVEVAFRLAADLTPQVAASGADAVLEVVEHFLIGVEFIGTRTDDRTKAGAFGGLADFLMTGGYVIGDHELLVEPAIEGLPIVVSSDCGWLSKTNARYPFENALKPAIAFASQYGLAFGGLKKGMIVTTGALSGLLPLPPSGQISVKVGDFKPVDFALRAK